jgi:hypothetical protein
MALTDEEKKQLTQELNGAVKDAVQVTRELRQALADAKAFTDGLNSLLERIYANAMERSIDNLGGEISDKLDEMVLASAEALKVRFDAMALHVVSEKTEEWGTLARAVAQEGANSNSIEMLGFGAPIVIHIDKEPH